MKLSAPYALKKYIVEHAKTNGLEFNGALNTEEEIDLAMGFMREEIGYDAQQDIIQGHWRTDLDADFSRYCETKSVAILDNYGNYIGFTRYYGGGKHFEEYSWYDTSIENAYFLNCQEKEVMKIERTWAKI